MATVKSSKHLPKAHQLFTELRHAIVTLKLKPGQSLSEKEISIKMGVSRQPVREAFIKLSEAGLVEILPQRGTFVVKISLHAVKVARFIRETLEIAVVREACGKLSEEFFSRMSELIAAQRVAAESNDYENFLLLDEAFHKSIAAEIALERVWEVIESEKAQMDRVRFLSFPGASPINKLIDQHEAILSALKKGDVLVCEAAVRVHLSEILTVLFPISREHPDLFED